MSEAQKQIESIVDELMAELIEDMAHSQPVLKLIDRLISRVSWALTELKKLRRTATGDYVFDGEEYGG